MPSSFNNGQRAIVREIAFEVVKTYQAEHAKEREQELELMTATIMTNVRTEIEDYGKNCPARHAAGRLRTWGPAFAGGICGVLLGAGAINIPTFVQWLRTLGSI